MKLITIIVPIYNVERYLEKCLTSLLGQTYTNIEIILVNDGSTDGSLNICRKYAEKDHRICILDRPNGGVADARNAGLDIARGEYIGFVDPDDWITKDMYQRLIDACEKYNADMSACKAKRVHDEAQQADEQAFPDITYLSQKETIEALVMHDEKIDMNVAVWSKLYKRELIGELRFVKGAHYEDVLFSTKIFQKMKNCVCVPLELYYYRTSRDGGFTSSGYTKYIFTDNIPSLEKRVNIIDELGYGELAEIDEFNFFCYIVDLFYGIYVAKKAELYDDTKKALKKLYHNPKVIKYVRNKEMGISPKNILKYKRRLYTAYFTGFSPECTYIIYRSVDKLRKLIKR